MPRQPKLGSGERFANCVKKVSKKGKSKDSAKKICASIGIKKYGKKKMMQLAQQGRNRK